ncbi:MAG: hypothetical protein IJ555_05940 [Ruminococcus sp.]|nr:hypothetical protein [Ruminococcus sp.]
MNPLGNRALKDKLERASELIKEAEETKSNYNNEALQKDNTDLRLISAALLLCCCELEALRETLNEHAEPINKS